MRCLVLLSSADIDYELRHRPDQTKDRGVLAKFRILHIFLVPSVKLQPWPSCRYTFTHFERQFFPQLPFPRTDKMPDTRRHMNISIQWQHLDIMLVLDQHLDIPNSRLDVSNNCCSLLWLSSDYMLNYAMDVIGSDQGIYLLDISWDPGGMAWPLLPELAQLVVFEGGKCVIILTAAYLVHATTFHFGYYMDSDGFKVQQVLWDQGGVSLSSLIHPPGGAYLGHNYCCDLVEIHPGFGYHR